MENKELYYTPDLEDIGLGYIYEYSTWGKEDEEWKPMVVSDKGFFIKYDSWDDCFVEIEFLAEAIERSKNPENYATSCGRVRTKYLDRQDIESLEWKTGYERKEFYEIFGKDAFEGYKIVDKKDYSLRYCPLTHHLYIKTYLQDESWECVYNGECKSINEFKKILAWLKIC